MLITDSEREGTTEKELSPEKCGKSVAESVAATKVWQDHTFFLACFLRLT